VYNEQRMPQKRRTLWLNGTKYATGWGFSGWRTLSSWAKFSGTLKAKRSALKDKKQVKNTEHKEIWRSRK